MGGPLNDGRPALGVATGIVALACAVPLIATATAIDAADLWLLARWEPWLLLLRSIALAGVVTALALALGVPLGAILGRTDLPGRRVLLALHLAPVFLPPLLLALGWFHLVGTRGAVGSPATSAWLFGSAGCAAVLALGLAPVVTALTALGVRGVDRSLVDAARTLAPPHRVLTGIVIPAARPAISLAALLVFALAFCELGVPMFLRVDVYPVAVFARLGGVDADLGAAAVLALPIVPIVFALVAIESRSAGPRALALLGLHRQLGPPLALGSRWIALAACLAAVLLGLAPLGALAWRALAGNLGPTAVGWLDSVRTSLVSAAAAAAIATAAGVVLGHALVRGRPVARAADRLALIAFFSPAAVLGIGVIAVWNRPSTAAVYTGLAVVVLGLVGRYAAIGVRAFAAAVAQSDASCEHAARAVGAGYLRRLVAIVLPLHWRGAVAAGALCAVFCLRDLESVVLYYPPGAQPLTVRIFTLEANAPEAAVAALALVQVAITWLLVATAAAAITRRS